MEMSLAQELGEQLVKMNNILMYDKGYADEYHPQEG